MIRPITCNQCKTGIGWYDTKFYNLVRPVIAEGVTVLVAVIECKCGRRNKFDGPDVKRRANRHRAVEIINSGGPKLAAA